MDIDRVEDLPVIIVAACCLHNICLFTGEDIEDFIDPPRTGCQQFSEHFHKSPNCIRQARGNHEPGLPVMLLERVHVSKLHIMQMNVVMRIF